ncbi:hypothetical protein C8F04DRAFT_1248903 [Mycena alexandri]|uniref:Uncharacterized protein n=1 Tax=Mycena alexandri TaxID=1745969 RepID=A0AAD6TIE2_9AGAR|nr:hypothetical protein C8F04DRAFT_1248903 [Mycena alexandri]
MDRLRKFSKVFHKDTPLQRAESLSTKPVYRGSKPLTVLDIHSHSPIERTRPTDDSYYYSELGVRPRRLEHPEEPSTIDILKTFPTPPPLKAVVSDAYSDGSRLYFPSDDLLPPPPEKVLKLIKERERTRTHEARLEQQRTPSPIMLPNTYGVSSHRRPLYANSHANISTRSLGANASLKAGPTAQRAVVRQINVVGHHPPPQRAYPETAPLKIIPRPGGQRQNPFTLPEGEHKRLRSVPTQLSASQRSVANEELYAAYPSTSHGKPRRL